MTALALFMLVPAGAYLVHTLAIFMRSPKPRRAA